MRRAEFNTSDAAPYSEPITVKISVMKAGAGPTHLSPDLQVRGAESAEQPD